MKYIINTELTNLKLFYILYRYCRSGEMVDTSDSKSDELRLLRVQVPPSVPFDNKMIIYRTAFWSYDRGCFLIYPDINFYIFFTLDLYSVYINNVKLP